MAAVTVSEMLAAESAAKSNGWSEEQLLNLAGERLGHAIGRHFPTPGTAVGYLGKGHNAGDTLVALRILRDHFGWNTAIRSAFPFHELAPLTRRKWDELAIGPPLDRPPAWRDLKGPLLLLDGLLGLGGKAGLRDPLPPFAQEMESLRQLAGARVVAVDLSSGMDADTGATPPGSVVADITFMIGNAKVGLLQAQAANATGALALVPVEALATHGGSGFQLISPQTMDHGKAPRPFDFHKGMAGRVAIVAGSADYTGAAVLAATGALRGGAGLIRLFVPRGCHTIVATKCPPEIIVSGFDDFREVMEFPFDSLVAGCGLGELDDATSPGLLELIRRSSAPAVIDADALNTIARLGEQSILTDNHVLTPHPGEFRRLAPDLEEVQRELAARAFTDLCPATLLLKGSRTLVTRHGAPLWCNSTGTPAMAGGGQGDLLAGVIGARLASGEAPLPAAALSAWLCGRAAEIALGRPDVSEESLTPGDVAAHLGAAFRDWKGALR